MIELDEALERLVSEPVSGAIEEVFLENAHGRTLAENVPADADMPPFDRSAMDGVAFAEAPTPGKPVPLMGTIAAGDSPWDRPLQRGECVAIMTGAPLPPGADRVIPVEELKREQGVVVAEVEGRSQAHIRFQGEVVKKGDPVLNAGMLLTPERVGVLASVGKGRVNVFSQPRVAIASTGEELVPVTETPGPGQIRDSNRWVIGALAASWGGEARYLPRLGDTPEEVKQSVHAGLESDILVFSGGVSMGEFDFVDKTLREMGVREIFHKVAIKPGKPVFVGRLGKKWIFGLPGNPVSTAVTARLFLRLVMARMQGHPSGLPRRIQVPVVGDLKPIKHRSTFVSGRWMKSAEIRCVKPVQTMGSGDAIHHAHGDTLIFRPAGSPAVSDGQFVEVWLTDETR